jgi:hypothetical protein
MMDQSHLGSKRALRGACLLTWLLAIGFGAVGIGCGRQATPSTLPTASPTVLVDVQELKPQVERFCGNCHQTPLPESFPQERWRHEVARGYEFYLASGRSDLIPPRQSDVTSYYRQLAPKALVFPPTPATTGKSRFKRANISWPESSPDSAAIAHILPLVNGDDPQARFVCCDMGVGVISWISMSGNRALIQRRQPANFPSHIVRTDLDGDGKLDYVVSDLGSFLPSDHDQGKVIWLRESAAGAAAMEEVVLLRGVGRVADAEPADFDGDGDLDIVVAVFGWHTTGNVLLLRRQGERDGHPHFETEVLDSRTGAIHVPVADLNGDGRPDFVALFSQEHESVDAFLNQGDGKFTRQVLFRAPDPSFGFSGMELVDLNRDGRLDILCTNGDTFDSLYLKPSHGVRWLENCGSSWRVHLLATIPGVHAAHAGDFDQDGDLDVAASCFIPPAATANQPELKRLVSLVWLEQQGDLFVQHEIEADNCVYATMQVADVNLDGVLDIVTGHFGHSPEFRSRPFTVWLNQGQLTTASPGIGNSSKPAVRAESADN